MQKIHLRQSWHTDTEHTLIEDGELRAELFRYPSGTEALRLSNNKGKLEILPWQGQQIWSAQFLERELAMKSMFDQPYPTDEFLRSYGGLLVHCGATAMGPPGPDDTHPTHGELPNARFSTATLLCGDDERGRFIGLSGTYQHTVAFNTNYLATMEIRLYESESCCHVGVDIHNLKNTPMELMYLAHINFRPVDFATLHYSAYKNPENIRVRKSLPSHVVPPDGYDSFLAELEKDPTLHHELSPEKRYAPEVVFYIDALADDDGYAYNLQQHPDGTADFVRHNPEELPHCIRWISRTPDQDCLGLALPATAEVEGLTLERKKGYVRELVAGDRFTCQYSFGCLDARNTADLIEKVGRISESG